MITDIFARRYSGMQIRTQYFEEDRRLSNQAAVMIMDPLWLGRSSDNASDPTEKNLKLVHDAMALEVGREYLSDRFFLSKYTWNGNEYNNSYTNSYATICKNYLINIPQDMAQGDVWMKERLSLVELAFQKRWKQIQVANRELPNAILRAQSNDKLQELSRALKIPGYQVDGIREENVRINTAFEELVRDFNERLRLALYKLTFHNGLLQLSEDENINLFVSAPFWDLLKDTKWESVDIQMKEAIDRRDNGDRTAAFHAVSAIESCIKIISDLKGWTRGTEKGAANYIDNLISQ
jgi:hypothetical protein